MPMSYSKRERLKTQKRKALENSVAAAKAHVEQVNRHIEKVQLARDEATKNGQRLAGLLEERDSRIAQLANAIVAFKGEALASAVAMAEMRGYIARVLEDDIVREVGPTKADPAVLDFSQRQHMEMSLQ